MPQPKPLQIVAADFKKLLNGSTMNNLGSIPPTIILAFGGPEEIKPQWIEGIREALMDIDNFLILHEAKRIVDLRARGERWSPSKVYKALTAPYAIRTRR